jgi:hypothetical protein
MRVFYRSRRPKCPAGPTVYEVAGAVRWCCADLCKWWDRLIGFGVPGVPASTDRAVNLAVPVPQTHGGTVLELVPVAFCPFCGEPVEAVRAK